MSYTTGGQGRPNTLPAWNVAVNTAYLGCIARTVCAAAALQVVETADPRRMWPRPTSVAAWRQSGHGASGVPASYLRLRHGTCAPWLWLTVPVGEFCGALRPTRRGGGSGDLRECITAPASHEQPIGVAVGWRRRDRPATGTQPKHDQYMQAYRANLFGCACVRLPTVSGPTSFRGPSPVWLSLARGGAGLLNIRPGPARLMRATTLASRFPRCGAEQRSLTHAKEQFPRRINLEFRTQELRCVRANGSPAIQQPARARRRASRIR